MGKPGHKSAYPAPHRTKKKIYGPDPAETEHRSKWRDGRKRIPRRAADPGKSRFADDTERRRRHLKISAGMSPDALN
jgi:hypothetical protein